MPLRPRKPRVLSIAPTATAASAAPLQPRRPSDVGDSGGKPTVRFAPVASMAGGPDDTMGPRRGSVADPQASMAAVSRGLTGGPLASAGQGKPSIARATIPPTSASLNSMKA